MYKNKSFLAMIFSVFLMMVGVGMIVALLPQKIIKYTGSGDTVALLASSFAISYILFQIPIGKLADRIGFKPLLVGGYLLCFCVGILYFFSNTPGQIFIGRFVQGFGEIPVWTLAPALLSIQYPQMKGKAIGIYNAAFHLGLTTGPVLGIVAQRVLPGNQMFLLYASFCLIGAIVIQIYTKKVEPNKKIKTVSIKIGELIMILSKKITLSTMIGIAFYGAAYGVFITIIPVYLIETKNFTSSDIGIFFSIFYIAISISQIIAGPLSDSQGRIKFMISGLFVAAICLFAFQRFDSVWTILVLGTASLGLGTFFVSSLAYLNEIVPISIKGTISGAYFLFWGIGYFLGPVLIGMCERNFGTGYGFHTFSSLVFCEAILLFFFYKGGCPKKTKTEQKGI